MSAQHLASKFRRAIRNDTGTHFTADELRLLGEWGILDILLQQEAEELKRVSLTRGEDKMDADYGADSGSRERGHPAASPPSGLRSGRKEEMSPFLAVFNNHVNDADKRARAHLARIPIRGPAWLAQVERIEAKRGGIMGIFDDWTKPTGVRRYIRLVTKFVNEDRDPPLSLYSLGDE